MLPSHVPLTVQVIVLDAGEYAGVSMKDAESMDLVAVAVITPAVSPVTLQMLP